MRRSGGAIDAFCRQGAQWGWGSLQHGAKRSMGKGGVKLPVELVCKDDQLVIII